MFPFAGGSLAIDDMATEQSRGILLPDRQTGEPRFFPVVCGTGPGCRKELDLTEARLGGFPEDLLQLTEVEDLKVVGDALTACVPETMRSRVFTTIPVPLCDEITNIPEDIKRMTNITSLSMMYTGLCEFPAAVGSLGKLVCLNLSQNFKMTSFPSGICPYLKCLKSLKMWGCQVDSLPSDFIEVKQLEHLDVRGNPLDIPVAVSELTKFRYVALSGDKLASFIQRIPTSNIRTIDIRDTCTPVSSIPSSLTRLPLLDTLYLDSMTSTNYYPLLRHHLVRAADLGQDLAVPPVEVIVWSGQNGVDAYYSSLENASASRQKRSKVVVNGRSMAGKTSLVNALKEALKQRKRKERSARKKGSSCLTKVVDQMVPIQRKGKSRSRRKKGRSCSTRNKQGSCLTKVEDRTVSVDQCQLNLEGVDVKILDTGGHNAYELTNQVVTSDKSLILTIIDSSQYDMTEEKFYSHVGKYLHISFDFLFQAYILLVMTKIDMCGEGQVQEFAKHIKRFVREFEKERKVSRRKESGPRHQRIPVHTEIMLTSAKSMGGIEELVDCITKILHQPGRLPSVERTMPQSWVRGEDILRLTADMLTPPISTVGELADLFRNAFYFPSSDPVIQGEHFPHLLNYLHQVGSLLHYPHHSFLCDFVFLTPQSVVDLLKTLYHHDIKSLNLTEVDKRSALLPRDVTDAEFETMKSELAENGTVSVDFLRLIFSHFGFNCHHYELLLALLFKFDLAYPKCKDADTHRHITHLIEHTMSHSESQFYSQTRKKVELSIVSDMEEKLRDDIYLYLKIQRTNSQAVLPHSSDQKLLSCLSNSGSSLLLPWFLPDSRPSDLPTVSPPSCACSQVVATYAFRHCVPLGLFDRLSARCSRHSVYTRHWKSGLYFHYGPVVAVFECRSTRPLPTITLTFTAVKSSNNMTRLCHVMWRCIQDTESLLETIPGAVVSRYVRGEAFQQGTVLEVGAQKSEFCPVKGGPSFYVQRTTAGSGIATDVMSTVKRGRSLFLKCEACLVTDNICLFVCLVTQSSLASFPLSEVFAADIGDALSDEQIRAVSRDIKDKWTDVADFLCLPDNVRDELSERGTAATVPHRMLKKFCELMPESAKVCVLCDALYEAGLQSIADKHFSPDLYTDRILRPPAVPVAVPESTTSAAIRKDEACISFPANQPGDPCSEDSLKLKMTAGQLGSATEHQSSNQSGDADTNQTQTKEGGSAEPSPKRGTVRVSEVFLHVTNKVMVSFCLLAGGDHCATALHVDVVVRCCSDKWRAMGRVLLNCDNTQVHNIVSSLSSTDTDSEKLHCIIERWQKRKGEEATVSELIEACGHPDIDSQGMVKMKLKEAGLL